MFGLFKGHGEPLEGFTQGRDLLRQGHAGFRQKAVRVSRAASGTQAGRPVDVGPSGQPEGFPRASISALAALPSGLDPPSLWVPCGCRMLTVSRLWPLPTGHPCTCLQTRRPELSQDIAQGPLGTKSPPWGVAAGPAGLAEELDAGGQGWTQAAGGTETCPRPGGAGAGGGDRRRPSSWMTCRADQVASAGPPEAGLRQGGRRSWAPGVGGRGDGFQGSGASVLRLMMVNRVQPSWCSSLPMASAGPDHLPTLALGSPCAVALGAPHGLALGHLWSGLGGACCLALGAPCDHKEKCLCCCRGCTRDRGHEGMVIVFIRTHGLPNYS